MKTLHPRIEALRTRTAGTYLTSRYPATKKQPPPDLKVRAEEVNGDWILRGYLSVWGVIDTYGTRTIKGCFAKSINDRGPNSGAKNKIIHLYMHNVMEPVGQYTALVEDDYGLYFECRVDKVPGTPERVYKQTLSGTINQYSYGFDYVWDKMEYNQTLDAVDMFECDLFEGSSVTIKPSNVETFTIRTKEDLNKELTKLGIESEEVIGKLTRKHQMQLKQLITRYKALAEIKPLENRPALDLSGEPSTPRVVVVGDYKINLNEF